MSAKLANLASNPTVDLCAGVVFYSVHTVDENKFVCTLRAQTFCTSPSLSALALTGGEALSYLHLCSQRLELFRGVHRVFV